MRMHYMFPLLDFGTAGEDYYVTGPKGRKGKLVDYGVHHCTETFTATTTAATVSVGTASDADAYGDELSLGTLAADAGSKSVRTTYRAPADIEAYILDPGLSLPADTKLRLCCVAPTGGTPAGMAHPFMIIDWED